MSVAFGGGQPRPEQRSQMAEQVFKNVRVLRGIPVNEFMATMGFFSASLGGSWEKYADDNDHKRTARSMIAMMSGINKTYFAGRRVLTCYSCHRGGERPRVTPNLAELYGPPPTEEPDVMLATGAQASSADQILDKYLEALGGAQRLASLTSFVAKGTYQGYGDEKHAVEVFAKAPNQRATVVRAGKEDSVTTYDGRAGWLASRPTERPLPLLELTGGDLNGRRQAGCGSVFSRGHQTSAQPVALWISGRDRRSRRQDGPGIERWAVSRKFLLRHQVWSARANGALHRLAGGP